MQNPFGQTHVQTGGGGSEAVLICSCLIGSQIGNILRSVLLLIQTESVAKIYAPLRCFARSRHRHRASLVIGRQLATATSTALSVNNLVIPCCVVRITVTEGSTNRPQRVLAYAILNCYGPFGPTGVVECQKLLESLLDFLIKIGCSFFLYHCQNYNLFL
jgi:hypothetical protein